MFLEVGGHISDCRFCHLEVCVCQLTASVFCPGSSAVVNIMRCDLSSGQMIGFALPLSFPPNRIYLRARNWLCSCHNWSPARRDGSACFCYYLFYRSQNTILNLHCIPRSHRPLHDQYPHQRLGRDSRILWSMFVELDLLSEHSPHRTPSNQLVWLASSLFVEDLSGI